MKRTKFHKNYLRSLIQARYFEEKDIDEYRECFHLFASSGLVTSVDELTLIMRSLGLSPTIAELRVYLKQKGNKMKFADFLDIMHVHTKKERIPQEILAAFRGRDPGRTGVIPARDLRHILLRWGECLSPREVDQLFQEANISPRGQVKYEEFVKIVCAPIPDYY